MYAEPCQTSKMKLFGKIVEVVQPLTSYAKSSMLDVWLNAPLFTSFFEAMQVVYNLWVSEKFGQKTLHINIDEIYTFIPLLYNFSTTNNQ